MLAFLAFVIFRILGESADASGIKWADGPSTLELSQNWLDYCPMVTNLTPFNMSRFAGDWYVWRNVRKEDSTRNCEVERFEVEDDNQMSSEISFFTEPDCKYIAVKIYYKLVDPFEPIVFKSRTNVSDPSTESYFQIIDTDYDSYATLNRDCQIINGQCSTLAVILVRHDNVQPTEIASRTFPFFFHQSNSLLKPEDFKKNHCHAC